MNCCQYNVIGGSIISVCLLCKMVSVASIKSRNDCMTECLLTVKVNLSSTSKKYFVIVIINLLQVTLLLLMTKICLQKHSQGKKNIWETAYLCLNSGSRVVLFLYPRHTKYVGVYFVCRGYIVFAFPFVRSYVRSFVCSYVRSFVRSFVFPSQGQSFCVKVYKTSYFKDPLMDFIHIWHDGRYRSKVLISTIPIPGVTLGSRSQT